LPTSKLLAVQRVLIVSQVGVSVKIDRLLEESALQRFFGAVDGRGAVEKWKTSGVAERLIGLSERFLDREVARQRFLGHPGQTCT